MTTRPLCLMLLALLLTAATPLLAQEDPPQPDRVLRIIAFGAHPDDAEFQLGGCAVKWARLGHKVKFVSATNGDIGHWAMAGGPLAKRRTAEVQEAARRMGIEVQVLDIHDGELENNLENRKTIARLIRDWQADRAWTSSPPSRQTGTNLAGADTQQNLSEPENCVTEVYDIG
jgi:N-acetylglucosamine malate deacetylase 1